MAVEMNWVSGWNDSLVRGICEIFAGDDEVDITVGVILGYHGIFLIESSIVKI